MASPARGLTGRGPYIVGGPPVTRLRAYLDLTIWDDNAQLASTSRTLSNRCHWALFHWDAGTYVILSFSLAEFGLRPKIMSVSNDY